MALAHAGSSTSMRASLSPRELDPEIAGTIPVWLDCDPGHDDAMAIVLAGKMPTAQMLHCFGHREQHVPHAPGLESMHAHGVSLAHTKHVLRSVTIHAL